MIISYQDVTKIYEPDILALENVAFDIDSGEFVSFIGKSGAGKTTLLKLLLAEERPTQGQVLLEGYDIHRVDTAHLPQVRRNVGAVFQDFRLLRSKNVWENVAYVMEVMGAKQKDIERDVAEVLGLVGLQDKEDQFPAELSGGEKQRAAIARALIHRPQVIVADEPTGNLDPYHTRDIINLLQEINKLGTTILLATHNKDVINRLGKRVIALDRGRVVRDVKEGKFVL